LTIDRLFDPPALSGVPLLGLKISANGRRVTFLRGKSEDKDRLDLWQFDVDKGTSQLLVDSNSLSSNTALLCAEEVARRERQRTVALSGILEYSFSTPGDSLLFSINGTLYHCRIASGGHPSAIDAIDTHGVATDATMSPRGGFVAYIRGQNLHVYDVHTKTSTALTADGGGAIKNGMAEFVAQEEMDRATGYWWSPDDSHIAFARVDETPVKLVERFEIAADGFATFSQRYPAAGENNVSVRLGVIAVGGGVITWIDLGGDSDVYLARVDWLPDSRTLAIHRETRDQRRLDLMFADIATGQSRIVVSETCDSWVELHQELTFLEHSKEFIWASARDGFRHLYLYDYSGHLLRRLTAGRWLVDDFRARAVKCVDEKNRLVYFSATEKSPLQRHLYCASLDTVAPEHVRRITVGDGIHEICMSPDAAFYIDNFSSRAQPPQVSMHSVHGEFKYWLQENRLDASHPDAPYAAENSIPEFGTLAAADGQVLYYRVFKPHDFVSDKLHIPAHGVRGFQRIVNADSRGT
jgi:dipeptidyl-peptidase-4